MVATAEKRYTVAEFHALPEEMTDGCELVGGRLVKKQYFRETENGMTPGGLAHALTVTHCVRTLGKFVEGRKLGETLIRPAFLVGVNRSQIRKPDIAFIAGPAPTDPDAILALLPALAVEIISPSNTAADLFNKVEEYLEAGVQLVWQLFPEHRSVIAFWPDRAAVFRPGDTITAEPALPGFSCPVTDLFPPPVNPSPPINSLPPANPNSNPNRNAAP